MKQAIKTLTLRIQECERQLADAKTLAERRCIQETIQDCRRQLSNLL